MSTKLNELNKTKLRKIFGRNYQSNSDYINAVKLNEKRSEMMPNDDYSQCESFIADNKSNVMRQDFFIKKMSYGLFDLSVEKSNVGRYGGRYRNFSVKRYSYKLTYNSNLFFIKKIGGVVTLIQKTNTPAKIAFTFYINSKNKLVSKKCFVYKTIHADSLIELQTKIWQRNNTAIQLMKQRTEKNIEIEKLKNVYVDFEDSLNSGNCEIGTKNFIQKNFENVVGAFSCRADYLLEIAGEQINFVRRAISEAVNRQAV